MRRRLVAALVLLMIGGFLSHAQGRNAGQGDIALPEVEEASVEMRLTEALEQRRSIRNFTSESISREELAALLWAAQGITQPRAGYRTAPSAGATYPLVVYAAVGSVDSIESGLYRYLPEDHSLRLVVADDLRARLHAAALAQRAVREAAVVLVIASVTERTARRYGNRAERYVAMEAGHAAQNIYLLATALGLGTVAIGAFDDAEVSTVLKLDVNESPLYLMPVGRP